MKLRLNSYRLFNMMAFVHLCMIWLTTKSVWTRKKTTWPKALHWTSPFRDVDQTAKRMCVLEKMKNMAKLGYMGIEPKTP